MCDAKGIWSRDGMVAKTRSPYLRLGFEMRSQETAMACPFLSCVLRVVDGVNVSPKWQRFYRYAIASAGCRLYGRSYGPLN